MPKKKASVIDIGKAITQISFTTLAAIGSATGNVLFAGIAAFPSAILTAFDSFKKEDEKHNQKGESVVLLAPTWWSTDVRSWDNLCEEINTQLLDILKQLFDEIQKEKDVITVDKIYQRFSDILMSKRLSWVTDEDKKRVAEYIAPLILENIDKAFNKKIESILMYRLHLDIHNISEKTTEVAISATENALWLKKIYEELAKNRQTGQSKGEIDQSASSLLYVVLQQTLASLTPQNLIETEAAFKNPTIGKELLEDISTLIERFEEYFDQIIDFFSYARASYARASRPHADSKQSDEDFFPFSPYELPNRILIANRKLITISNEMRSIYRSLDKKFVLTPHNKELIDHITSICAQISEMEGVLIVGLRTNPSTLQVNEDIFNLWFLPSDNFLDRVAFSRGHFHIHDYHLALIELNNYKIALREAIDNIGQIN